MPNNLENRKELIKLLLETTVKESFKDIEQILNELDEMFKEEVEVNLKPAKIVIKDDSDMDAWFKDLWAGWDEMNKK